MGVTVVTEDVVVKWPKLSKPETNPNYPTNPPTYSVQMILVPGKQDKTIKDIEVAIKELRSKHKNAKAPESWEPRDDGTIELRANAQQNWDRQVIDENLDPIEPMICPQVLYGGAICQVAFDLYVNKTNRICVGLLAVQKRADGERLGAEPPKVEELFKPIKVSGSNPNPLD